MKTPRNLLLATLLVSFTQLAAFLPQPCQAGTKTWTGSGGDSLWSNPLNWSGNSLPAPTDDVTISTGSGVQFADGDVFVNSVNCTKPFTITGGSLTATNGITFNGSNVNMLGGQLGSWVGLYATWLNLGANVTAASTLLLLRNQNTLQGVIPAAVTIVVEGDGSTVGQLTLYGVVTNHGTLALTSWTANQSASVVLYNDNSWLVNAADGRLESRYGMGGPRSYTGTIENWGTIAIDTNTPWYYNGTAGSTFRQRGGVIRAAAGGWTSWTSASLDFSGGQITPGVHLFDSWVAIGPGVTQPSTLYMRKNNNYLSGGLVPPAVTLVIADYANAEGKLTIHGVVTNHGTIALTSWTTNQSASIVLYNTNSWLVNASDGRLESNYGLGGNRTYTGTIENWGTIAIDTNTPWYYNGTAGSTFRQRGGLIQAAAGGWTSWTSASLDFSGGQITPGAHLLDSWVAIGPGVTQPSTLYLRKNNNYLSGGLVPPAVTIVVADYNGEGKLTVYGVVTNHGTISLTSWTTNQSASIALYNTNSWLVNASDGRLESNYGLGGNRTYTGTIENWGTIAIDTNTPWYYNGTPTANFRQRGGVIQSAPGGWTTWTGASLDFTGGQITANAHLLDSWLAIGPGVTQPSTLYLRKNNNYLSGGLVPPAVTLVVADYNGEGKLTVYGVVTNHGTISLTSWTANQSASIVPYNTNSWLVNAADGRLESLCGLGGSRSYTGMIENWGTIAIDTNTPWYYNGTPTSNFRQRGGVIQSAPGGWTTWTGASLDFTGGQITANTHLFDSWVAIGPGVTQPSTLYLRKNNNYLSGGLVPPSVTLVVADYANAEGKLTIYGVVTNHGTLALDSWTANQSASVAPYNANSWLVNASDGRIEARCGAAGARTLSGLARNQGTLTVSTNGLNFTGGSLTNDPTGIITGTGWINASGYALYNSGTIRPGGSPGGLSFTGTYQQTDTGRLEIELGSIGYDQFSVSGSASLGGTLAVTYLNNFLPAVGTSNRILTCTSRTGQFANHSGLVYYTNAALVPVYLANAVDLLAQSVTNPVFDVPQIVVQPQSLAVGTGDPATFSAAATGTRPLAWQWQFNGANLANETNSSFNLQSSALSDAGGYRVIVSNAGGAVTSLVATLTVTNPFCAPPPAGLVAWWKAEGNANDLVGGNNGTLMNGAGFAPGRVGSAFSFDAASLSYVEIPYSPRFDINVQGTVELWHKLSPAQPQFACLISRGRNGDAQNNFEIYIRGGYYKFSLGDGTCSSCVSTISDVPAPLDDRWHHLAFTWDGSVMNAYVDGVLNSTKPQTIAPATLGTPSLFLGSTEPSDGRVHPNGQIDEVGLYNRTLVSNEIAAIYAAGSAGKCFDLPSVSGVAVARVSTESETSGVWPVGTSQSGFTSSSADSMMPFNQTSVQFRGWQQGGNTSDVLNGANLVYRYRVEFLAPVVIDSLRLSGAAFNGPGSVFRLLDGAKAPIATWETYGGNTYQSFTWIPPQTTGTVFYIDEYDTSTHWRYRDSIAMHASPAQLPCLLPALIQVPIGQWIILNPVTSATGQLNYQWQLSGTVLAGATNADLVLPNLQPSQSGDYRLALASIAAGTTNMVANLLVTNLCAGGPPVSYGSSGWRYCQTGWGQLAGFQIGQEPSGFADGQGGFGNGGCGAGPVVTRWSENSDLLLRRTICLPEGASGLSVGVAIDNDVQVWFNGVDVSGGMRTSGGCAVQERYVFSVPDGLVQIGENLLAIRAHDYGGAAYADARVSVAKTNPPVRADLLPSSLACPLNAIGGQIISVAWVVTNQGPIAAQSPWQESIIVADNAAGTNGATLVTMTSEASLPTGASVARSQQVIVPGGLSGAYWFVVRVDSGNQVAEGYGETNNVAAVRVQVVSPDLEVRRLTSAATASYGQAFPVEWVVANGGTGPANGTWSDRVWFSTASNSLSGATLLAGVAAGGGSLAANSSYTNSAVVTVPLDSQSVTGSFWLVAQADAGGVLAESDEGNNLRSVPLVLAMPPLPDLTVGQCVAPVSALPGQAMQVSWAVTNLGPAGLTNVVWREAISLTNVETGATPVLLGAFTFTNTLAAGESLGRTQSVAVPVTGVAGNWRVAVAVDSAGAVVESCETNNAALAAGSTFVPQGLSLYLPVPQVAEDAANPVISGLVSRNGDISGDLAVALAMDVTNQVSVPTSVTIPAGQASAAFSVTVLRNHIVTGNQAVTLSASALGHDGASATLTVLDADRPSLTFQAPAMMLEGTAATATLTREGAGGQALTVALSSSSALRLGVPAVVVIPANSNSVSCPVSAVDNSFVEGPRSFTITAAANGFNSGSAQVTVQDNDWPEPALTLGAASVSEGAGPGATYGIVRRGLVSDQPLSVALESSNTLAAVVPPGVVIPAGQMEARFSIAAVATNAVTGPRTALISAWVLDSISGARLGLPVSQLLTVNDQDQPTLTVTISKKVVPMAVTNATTGTVTRNTPATNDLVVSLSSSVPTAAVAPATVKILAGQASASFAVSSLNDGVTHGNQSVTISASATGFNRGADWLMVTDINLPDMVVENVTGPAATATQSYVDIGFRVANRGLASGGGMIVQRVLLSRQPYLAGAQEELRLTNSATLPVGEYFGRTVTVRMPQQAGDWWVLVEVDQPNWIAENNEENNVGVLAAPIHVAAAYSAGVQTPVTVQTTSAPVPISGSATNILGGRAAFVPVNIHIAVRGAERVISVVTDADGNFNTSFIPLPGEAGHYYIGASHPGVSAWATNDDFTILGMGLSPGTASLVVLEGSTGSGSVKLLNRSDLPLSGLSATVVDASANLVVTPVLSNTVLAGSAEVVLGFTVRALNASIPRALATVRVSSAEGVTADLLLYVTVEALRPQLAAQPASLTAGMVRGGQALVEFDVVNTGGASSGPVQVVLPQLPWLTVASTNPMPSLEPGATNRVTLLLTPAADLPLGPYAGTLVLQGTGASAAVPFNFRALSDAIGSVRVTAVDEYTYYAEGAPKVANAAVTLIDAVAGTNVASGVTGADGSVLFTNVPEAYYVIDVQAPDHSGWRATVLALGGQTNEFEAFLSRQTVKYTWTVVPTEIEDRTRITIETTFETVVPIPVVTVDPNLIDLANVTGAQTQIDVTVANHGLVAAKDARLSFPPHPCWELKPLIEELGDIPAGGSFTVPVIIRRLGSTGCSPCQFTGGVTWTLRCANRVNSYFVPIQVINAGYDCGGAVVISGGGGGGGGGGWIGGGGGGGSTGTTYVPPNIVVNTNCDCAARVKLRIDQEAVISRDAFKATLEVDNGMAVPMTGVRVDVYVRNRAGEDVTGLFAIREPLLAGLTNVSGQGILGGLATGKAEWIIIPTVDAAPTNAVEYFVGGTLTYTQDGRQVTVPLSPASITVLPLAQLDVKYFHERDVFADDPFTPQVEPSIPFNLAVMIQNTGAGIAKNLRITSAQPLIVSNESGLLIDFKIIATEMSGSNMVPSLTADFGTINSGEIKVGRWLLQSTLQGLFLDYKASFEHLDALGNKRIAIITNVEIHEMIHLVRDPRPGADTVPDFLVNDVPDPKDRPDTLYLSDGSVAPVSVVESGVVIGALGGGSLQVTLTAAMPPGWAYLRVPDPGTNLYRLARVVRSDGREIWVGTNAWTTDRTFIGGGQRPIRENILHILDHDSTGRYVLQYQPAPGVDVQPPVSTVAALPASSYGLIPVTWSGTDEAGGSGLAFFDVFVSQDGGPFVPWLSRTTQRSATYFGSLGSRYAFYSRATDAAGNTEAAPALPQADTLASLVNHSPVLPANLPATLDEGQILAITNSATDADLPEQTLTYTLGADAPLGMSLTPHSGLLTWPTTEATGPCTNIFTMTVMDNGLPPLSATGLVTLVVREVNTPPMLAAITNYTVNEGQLLLVTNRAADFDLPANRIAFSLAADTPDGVTINTTNGLLRWVPTDTQGPSTNLITIVATDDGSPPLSATQHFTVVVRDTMPDVTLSIGTTNLMVGESNSVPIWLGSTLPLAELTLTIETSDANLTNVTLSKVSGEIVSIQPPQDDTSPRQFTLTLQAYPLPPSQRELARLTFKSIPAEHSIITPLRVVSFTARNAAGQSIANVQSSDGQLFIVGREPLLAARHTVKPSLTVYGHPGAGCAIESRTNLFAGKAWTEVTRLLLGGRVVNTADLPVPGDPQFFRAYEFTPPAPTLTIQNAAGPAYALSVSALPGSRLGIESATNITAPIIWQPLFELDLTNSPFQFWWTNDGNPSRYFRALTR